MTSHPLALSSPDTRTRGFTLTELLVVIGIIAVLIGIVLAVVVKAQKSAHTARIKADLQAISNALEQYHNDLNVYPMSTPRIVNGSPQADWTHVLAKALVSPEAATIDGADSFGFRTQRDAGNRPYGKIYPAYLNADSFKTRLINNRLELLDYFGSPIAYYPRRSRTKSPATPVIAMNPPMAAPGQYHQYDGPYETDGADVRIGVARALAFALGDRNGNFLIDATEQQQYDGPFVLISPGADTRFGTLPRSGMSPKQAMLESDDIYNFEWK